PRRPNRPLAAASPPDQPLPALTPRRLTEPATDLDGLPSELSEAAPPEPASHPNGALRIDHIVVFTPELARTSGALEGAGLSLRRIREPDEPGPPARQAFFRLGEVILEVVEAPQAGEGPARFWGLTLCVSDIDASAELLGERLGEVRDAVQAGRRIATVRREADLGLPVALISDEPR
ncbi:MAG: VOC family protein, partial [Solirubrobacterales bacterium]